jgi:hypothetical protein
VISFAHIESWNGEELKEELMEKVELVKEEIKEETALVTKRVEETFWNDQVFKYKYNNSNSNNNIDVMLIIRQLTT